MTHELLANEYFALRSHQSRSRVLAQAEADFRPDVVAINHDLIKQIEFPAVVADLPHFEEYLDPAWPDVEAACYLMQGAAQAFRFWTQHNDGSLAKYREHGTSGSRAMYAQLRHVWRDGGLPQDVLDTCFETAPAAAERKAIADSLSRESEGLTGVATAVCNQAFRGKVGVAEAELLAQAFPLAFRDPYLKKAQLAVLSIASAISHRHGIVVEVDLTALADYQVPRVLRAMGILEYTGALEAAVTDGRLIPPDRPWELAIRAATILAVDAISKTGNLSAATVDNLLWSNQDLAADTPFHLTLTNHY